MMRPFPSSEESFLLSRGCPSIPRRSFRQDILDTKARVEHAHLYDIMIYTFTQQTACQCHSNIVCRNLYHQILHIIE
jgi:hypothetical protein